jgi:hypothetical protein
MTLIELLVGIVVTAIATTAGYAAFSSIVENRRSAGDVLRELQSAASTRNLLASWFEAGRVLRDTGTAMPRVTGIGATEPDDILRLVTTAPTPLGSQQTQIYMYIDRDPFTPEEGLVAEFTALNQPVDSVLMVVVSKKMEISRQIMGLEVLLLDQATRLWVSPTDGATNTPIGLLVQLHPAWNDSLPPLLRLPFVYPMGTTR